MKTAVIIGDSHVDSSVLATTLKSGLKSLGYDAKDYGIASSSAATWLNNDKICRPKNLGNKCVDKTQISKSPDLLIISLGTNDCAGSKPSAAKAEEVVARIKKLAAYFDPKQLVWIGPPWLKDTWPTAKNDFMEPLYEAAKRTNTQIFDSRISTRQAVEAGSGDGVHLGSEGSKIWGNAVIDSIKGLPIATTQSSKWIIAGIASTIVLAAIAVFVAKRKNHAN